MKFKQASSLLAASLLLLSAFRLSAADVAAADQPISAAQAAQMESVKRQQLIMSANQAVADGLRLLNGAKYDDAALRFQFALDSLTSGGVSASLYNRAQAGLAAAKCGQAKDFAKDAKFAEAASLLQEAISLQPNNATYTKALEDLKQEQIAYERQVQDPEGTVNNPAVTDEFKDKLAAIQKLLLQGDAYFGTGQFDKSEDAYSKILILDPYNKAARAKMDHIEKYKTRAEGFRHEEYEQSAMTKVNQGWSESVSPDIVVPPKVVGSSIVATNRAKITHKLQSIIIDKVNFDKLDITTVMQFLQDKSKELDPDHEGVNFVLRLSSDTPAATDAGAAGAPTGAAPAVAPAAGAAAPDAQAHAIHREVSITLDNIPLSELLTYITSQTNLQYSVEDYAVYLRPSIDEGETLSVRTYLVPPDFFKGSQLHVTVAPPTDYSSTTVESVSVKVQDELTSLGISFPDGATATFLPSSSKLVVRNTPEQLDLIGNLIENGNKDEPRQVQIEAKLAEFNQDAIKALSFNYVVGTGLITSGLYSPFSSFGTSTALRTSNTTTEDPALGGLTPNSIDSLIQANVEANNGVIPTFPITGTAISPTTPNQLVLGAVLNSTGLAAIVDAINNTKGASLLSAPSVTTRSESIASIEIVREFPYPTSFEKPKLSNNTALAYSSGRFGPQTHTTIFGGIFITAALPVQLAIPPTPREFHTENIGVTLEVKPTAYTDQRIDLDITKCQVKDFDGFINYGVPITALLTDTGAPTVLTEGVINQPVFNLRDIVTKLQVLDGQTAVLGGLMREDTQEVNDKVPVLGDLPLVGRLFQSKVSERTKKNLLIFVTAKMIHPDGKPKYIKSISAEPVEEKLPDPDQQIGPGVTLPPLPEGAPNS